MTLTPHAQTAPTTLAGRRVLVTGASGFIGQAVCAQLVAAGAVVHGAGNSRPPPAGVVPHRAVLPQDADRLIHDAAPHTVIHLASPVDLRREASLYEQLRPGILDATVAVALACLGLGARMVQVGSCEELAGGTLPFCATQPLAPTSPYSALKAAAATWVLQLHRWAGLQATVVRPFRTIGPGEQRGVVAAACRAALAGQGMDLTDGQQVREWNDVDAIASGLVALAGHPDTAGRSLSLGGGPRLSVAELVRQIYRQAGADPALVRVGSLPRRAAEVDAFWGDHSETRALLGGLPQTRLADTIDATLSWHRATLRSGL